MPKTVKSLQTEIDSTIAALQTKRAQIASYKPQASAKEILAEIELYLNKIKEAAEVQNIADISPQNIAALRKNITFIVNMDFLEKMYQQFAEHCVTYKSANGLGKSKAEIVERIQQVERVIADGRSVINQIKILENAHEESWSSKQNQSVGGVAEVSGSMQELLFQTEPVFMADYQERLLALIDLMIEVYKFMRTLSELELNHVPKTLRESKREELVIKIDSRLDEDAHCLSLRKILQLDTAKFYAEVSKLRNLQGKNNRSVVIVGNNVSPVDLKPNYIYEMQRKMELVELRKDFSAEKKAPAPNPMDLFSSILGVQQEYRPKIGRLTALINKISTRSAELEEIKKVDLQSKKLNSDQLKKLDEKLFFLLVCKNIYKKILQQYKIADEICSYLFNINPTLDDWNSFKSNMKNLEVDLFKTALSALDESVEKLLASDVNQPFELPQNLRGVTLWGHGTLGHFVIQPLAESIKVLQVQALKLEITPDSLQTPVTSRPVTVERASVASTRSSVWSMKKVRESIISVASQEELPIERPEDLVCEEGLIRREVKSLIASINSGSAPTSPGSSFAANASASSDNTAASSSSSSSGFELSAPPSGGFTRTRAATMSGRIKGIGGLADEAANRALSRSTSTTTVGLDKLSIGERDVPPAQKPTLQKPNDRFQGPPKTT